MGIIIRQSTRSSLISFAGIGISAFTILWLYPRYLTREQIGILTFLEAAAWTFLSFGSLGVFNIADRFFPYFRQPQDARHNGYLTFLTLYLGVGFLLVGGLMYAFKSFWVGLYQKSTPEAIHFFDYLLPFVFCLMVLHLAESYARIHLQTVVSAFYKEVLLKVVILLSLLAFAGGFIQFEQLVGWRLSAFGVAGLGICWFLGQRGWLRWGNPFRFVSRKLLREMVIYGSFIVLGGMSNLVISKIDLLMIPAWLSAADLGVYTLSFFIGTIIEVPRKAIGQISTPLIAQAWAKNDLGQLSKMYQSSARNQFVIGLFIFLLIWLNVGEIFALIPNGERFIAGQYVILFIGLTRLIDMVTGLNQEILLQSSAYRFNFRMLLVLALLNILFNAWLIPALGISGAALGTLLAYLLYNLAKGWFLYRQFGLQPFTWPIIPTAGLGGLVYGIGLFFPMTGWAALDIFLRSSLVALLFGAGVWAWKLSPELVAMAQNLWKKT